MPTATLKQLRKQLILQTIFKCFSYLLVLATKQDINYIENGMYLYTRSDCKMLDWLRITFPEWCKQFRSGESPNAQDRDDEDLGDGGEDGDDAAKGDEEEEGGEEGKEEEGKEEEADGGKKEEEKEEEEDGDKG